MKDNNTNSTDNLLEYLDEMEIDSVELSKDELQKIHKLELEKIKSKKVKVSKRFFNWKISSGLVAACFVLVLSISISVPKIIEHIDQPTKIVNPYIEYNDVDTAIEELGYDAMVPTKMPEEYTISNVVIIDNTILSIDYETASEKINYRTSEKNEDISGDFTIYEDVKQIQIDNKDITIKGNHDKIHLVSWKHNNQSFSMYSNQGLSQKQVIGIIENIE
ncbi:DUF4367 domain-containing protein [Vallitalea guaymasensis]|uniref:DUF4367 domain-containing protein n=1 Tax=Vallitalea guaymasensis TaxID=1185412 RepID=UPI0023523F7B|nr:DUF4367 domain-containing protein [Vallitalea guaymasensis]